MGRKGRKLTPAQRKVALRNLAKARAARKGPSTPTKKKRRSKPLTAKKRRALGYHKERTMAAKKKRKGGSKKRRGGGRRGGGIMSGIEWGDMAGAGAYGWLERQAVQANTGAGETPYIDKIPLFFEGIGYAGCSAVIAHVISKNVGGTIGKIARHYARGTFDVAAYKLMKNGGLYKDADEAKAALAGDGDDDLGADDDEFSVGLGDDDDSVGYGADGIAGEDDD